MLIILLSYAIFHNNNRNPYRPWHFTCNDDRLKMTLKPLIPDRAYINTPFILVDTASLHGYYTGYVILDNGEKIEIKDMLGHAEDIKWRW